MTLGSSVALRTSWHPFKKKPRGTLIPGLAQVVEGSSIQRMKMKKVIGILAHLPLALLALHHLPVDEHAQLNITIPLSARSSYIEVILH